ncbi:hypothetical protein LX15_001866 [Streptoalloteichus tenebrarius]|uniref:Uncharacterized protein n=1 Tax=Streptoalloteichus tenebrarius (strain ATCC 17920 / DSM 40477 / JCM 4838 / CBS 697.72 / NBRC 16177 / NCIMB 11028 / NRRL B-12390 / A12253. 1 / ISP 5477) TaxID=1933 RepID=A0ABT1HRQ9_STRSD|nr:hypothetical protein [Streptoalloteichus tenebrarius]
MPTEIPTDPRTVRWEALVLGEGETRVAALLADHRARADAPGVMWLDPIPTTPATGGDTRQHAPPGPEHQHGCTASSGSRQTPRYGRALAPAHHRGR